MSVPVSSICISHTDIYSGDIVQMNKANEVNTITADALASSVARTSAAQVLIM